MSDPFQFPRPQPQTEGLYPAFDSGAGSGATQCRLDGVNMPCDVVMGFANHGFGQIDPRTSYLGPGVVLIPEIERLHRPNPKTDRAWNTFVTGFQILEVLQNPPISREDLD